MYNPNSAAGIVTAVTEAFVRHESALKRFIARFMRNAADVEDIAQEAFLRAYSAEQGKPIEQPKSFLFRIAKHVALTELAQKSRQITDRIEGFDELPVMGNEVSVEDEVEARQTLGLHCEAVARLPQQCRHVYLLRKVHGMSHREIAGHLGIAVSTVEKHLMKGVELCDRFVREKTTVEDAAIVVPATAKGRAVSGK